MVTINLLPWRTYQAIQQRQVISRIMMISCLISACFICSVHYFLTARIQKLSIEAQSLATLSQQMQMQNKNPLSLSEVNIAWRAHLTAQRVFAKLFSQSAEAACLTALARTHEQISFQGKAVTFAAFTQFLQTASLFNLFADIKIDEVIKETDAVNFKLSGVYYA